MNFQNMAPNAKRSLLLTTVFGAIAVAVYLFALEPTEAKLAKAQTQLEELAQKNRLMTADLAGAAKTDERLAALETRKAAYDAAMLTPLLESYAMRAKSLLDPLVAGAGLAEPEYEALPRRALPVPKRLPRQLHARQPVKLTVRGSYNDAVSFLLRVEREFPLVALEAFDVTAQQDPDEQKIVFIFEWPAKGLVTRK